VNQLDRPEASKIVMTAAEQLREEGRKEGRKEGRTQNQRDYLIRLLSQRFGPLPASVLADIQRADVAALDLWFDRSITAPSLDAVFANEP
jgi:predicted transposase YdaD